MAYSSFTRVLDDSNNIALTGAVKGATFQSAGYKMAEFDQIGIVMDIATATGTSPTLDVKVQMSKDGTTWLDTYPAAENTETQAALAQITAAKETAEFWPCWLAAGSNDQLRFVFTIGGTGPSFTFTNAWVVGRKRARGA